MILETGPAVRVQRWRLEHVLQREMDPNLHHLSTRFNFITRYYLLVSHGNYGNSRLTLRVKRQNMP